MLLTSVIAMPPIVFCQRRLLSHGFRQPNAVERTLLLGSFWILRCARMLRHCFEWKDLDISY
jgi:hypothetical protein